LVKEWATELGQYIDYYAKFSGPKRKSVESGFEEKIYMMYELYKLASKYEQADTAAELEKFFKDRGLME
jgi:hypothetical protein